MRARRWQLSADSSEGNTRSNGVARLAVVAMLAVLTVAGCAKMDAALARQWMVVNFSSDTSVATALHVRAACSHIQNAKPLALPAQRSIPSVVYGIRFDTTNASPANIAQLQSCLQKFPSVRGFQLQDAGDQGS
ncbi:MAG: hypothetical protein J2P27_17835 [Actinobacteria bacterium]|nr:hypothetical protein [Actinomycetota bacterium]